jgi:hypothetical protein
MLDSTSDANDPAAERSHVAPLPLVAEIWQRQPPVTDVGIVDGPEACVAGIRRTLAAVAARAASIATAGPRDDLAAATLLRETACAMHDALGAENVGGVTPWVDRIRFARMERWLAARAETDPDAEPAASLCLWVIEHLEMAVPLPRRILPP